MAGYDELKSVTFAKVYDGSCVSEVKCMVPSARQIFIRFESEPATKIK